LLVTIYWFRSRYRNVIVSSLVLWTDTNRTSKGGRKLQKITTPLPFYLELLVLLLLLFGALIPMLRIGDQLRALIVVLDDSYSMQTEVDGESVRDRVIDEIKIALKTSGTYAIKFIVAGHKPQLLGPSVSTTQEAIAVLSQWQCNSPTSHINGAIALANELALDTSELWVMTDHAPESAMTKESNIHWFALGKGVANMGIIHSSRNYTEDTQRMFLEIKNFSKHRAKTVLHVAKTDGTVILEKNLTLTGNGSQRLTLDLKNLKGPVTATIDDDALAIDNTVHLFPQRLSPVRVKLDFNNALLKGDVQRALDAIGEVIYVEHRVELLLSDKPQAIVDDFSMWGLQFHISKDPQPYIGPFVMDKNHVLCQGLSLAGIVWSTDKLTELPGRALVTAGNIPLITDDPQLGGSHMIHLAVNPDQSTLTDAIGWPVIISNLLQWRQTYYYGLQEKNLRLGDNATVRLKSIPTEVTLTHPDGTMQQYTPNDNTVNLPTNEAGLYNIQYDQQTLLFGVNALGKKESNILYAQTAQWGQRMNEATLLKHYRSISWIFWLAALAVLVIHQIWLKRN